MNIHFKFINCLQIFTDIKSRSFFSIGIVLLLLLFSCRSKTTNNLHPSESNEKKVVQNDTGSVTGQQIVDFKPALLSKKFKKYKGGMFDIQYPDNFIVKTSNESVWEAHFKSPDGLVEFYVFSPWGITENQEIELKPNLEIEVQNEVKKIDVCLEIRYITYKAKDNSYFRSYEDKNGLECGGRTIIGLKYKNKEAYEYYKETYLKFKNSLVQYADGSDEE